MVDYSSRAPGVYLEELPSGSQPIAGVGTSVPAFVGLAASGPFDAPTLVTNWTQFQTAFGGFIKDAYLAHAVHGYFLNGGTKCYVTRIGSDDASATARGLLPSAADPEVTPYVITARDEDAPGEEITIEIKEPSDEGDDSFTLRVKRGSDEETFDGLTTKSGPHNVVTAVKAKSKIITIEEQGKVAVSKRKPAPGTYTITAAKPSAPVQLSTDDYVGDVDKRTGFGGLQEIDDVTMLCVPDLMAAYKKRLIDLDGVKAVQQAMIDHCELMKDRVAILDTPPGYNAQRVLEWKREKSGFNSAFAALYWPWVKVLDPSTGENIYVPPSGHMAGIWSRSDSERGVHKAPANENVRGVLDIETKVTPGEHDLLNPEGINVIRSFPGRGIRVWGARTLSSDTTWQYLNVRRLFNYIEESIVEGTQWAVFEPNDFDLWQRLRRSVTAFLTKSWRDGALFGAKPDQAFYVKCDEETNPSDQRELGQVTIEVGIAPTKPAEFVVFQVRQLIGSNGNGSH